MKSSDPSSLTSIIEGFISNPIPFLVAISIIAVALYFGFEKLWYGPRVATQDATIANLKNQVEDYKEKLKGRTPEQAAAQIADLEKQTQENKLALLRTESDLQETRALLTRTSEGLNLIANPPRGNKDIYVDNIKIGIASSVPDAADGGKFKVSVIETERPLSNGDIFEVGSIPFVLVSHRTSGMRQLGLEIKHIITGVILSPTQ